MFIVTQILDIERGSFCGRNLGWQTVKLWQYSQNAKKIPNTNMINIGDLLMQYSSNVHRYLDNMFKIETYHSIARYQVQKKCFFFRE